VIKLIKNKFTLAKLKCNFFLGTPQSGASSWEILTIVIVIGSVFGFAYPKYRMMRVKAFQSDARLNLINLDKMQQDYFFEYDKYADDLKEIKFRPTNSQHYNYRIMKSDSRAYIAEAMADIGRLESCTSVDIIRINQDKVITQVKNGVESCQGMSAFKN
jgi:hypothetical protein